MRLLVLLLASVITLSACTSKPEGVQPVTGFQLEQYLGTWYEIARLPHSFEEGLSSVTAEYSVREDGGVKVVNRGFDAQNEKWEEAEGKAYFVKDASTGYLKVSFFGPFYASYIIIELDEEYRYAMVSGPDREYLWILSRTPKLRDSTLNALVDRAEELGFDTDKLIYVEQNQQIGEFSPL